MNGLEVRVAGPVDTGVPGLPVGVETAVTGVPGLVDKPAQCTNVHTVTMNISAGTLWP